MAQNVEYMIMVLNFGISIMNDIEPMDLPAEWADGSKEWYLHDKRHRTDGPAVEYANGYEAWYYEGKQIVCQSTQEFQRLIRLKAFW
jgi:hypothetical protein